MANSSDLGCAVYSDSTLKDASKIEWHFDEDDDLLICYNLSLFLLIYFLFCLSLCTMPCLVLFVFLCTCLIAYLCMVLDHILYYS